MIKNSLAGADIAEMSQRVYATNYVENYLGNWDNIFDKFQKPIIAAVNGYAVHNLTELIPYASKIISSLTVGWRL